MKYVENGKVMHLAEYEAESVEARLLRLEDEREIRELLYHYTRCVDRGDSEGIGACYCEDGSFYPSDDLPPIQGRRRITKLFSKLRDPAIKSCMHYITNQQIHFENPDEALVFAYFYSNKSFSDGKSDENTWGGYELRAVRDDDGQWRMRSHKIFFTRQTGTDCDRVAENLNRPWPPIPEKIN